MYSSVVEGIFILLCKYHHCLFPKLCNLSHPLQSWIQLLSWLQVSTLLRSHGAVLMVTFYPPIEWCPRALISLYTPKPLLPVCDFNGMHPKRCGWCSIATLISLWSVTEKWSGASFRVLLGHAHTFYQVRSFLLLSSVFQLGFLLLFLHLLCWSYLHTLNISLLSDGLFTSIFCHSEVDFSLPGVVLCLLLLMVFKLMS